MNYLHGRSVEAWRYCKNQASSLCRHEQIKLSTLTGTHPVIKHSASPSYRRLIQQVGTLWPMNARLDSSISDLKTRHSLRLLHFGSSPTLSFC